MSKYRVGLPFTAPGQRRGRINKNKGNFACDRVVYLPFDLATIFSAVQNFRIDLAKGIHSSAAVWENVQASYLEEALRTLQEDGCNLYPGENDEPWIQAHAHGIVPMPSQRAQKLNGIFAVFFSRDNTNLFKHPLFPRPEVINTGMKISALEDKVNQLFAHH